MQNVKQQSQQITQEAAALQTEAQRFAPKGGAGHAGSQAQATARPSGERPSAAHGMQGGAASAATQIPSGLISKIEKLQSSLHSFEQNLQQLGASELSSEEQEKLKTTLSDLSRHLKSISQSTPSRKQSSDKLISSLNKVTEALKKPGAKSQQR